MFEIPNLEKHKASLRYLINHNQHTTALIYIADCFGVTLIKKKLELIDKLHYLEGHMPKTLGDYRMELSNKLEAYLNQYWNNEQVKELFSI